MPALDEINDKTDIRLSYSKVGENLEGVKPRVSGLIFFIKPKDKTKLLLPTEGDTPPLPGIELTTEYEERSPGPAVTTLPELTAEEFTELFKLFKDIWIDERPEAITSKLLIDGYVTLHGKDLVLDAFVGLIDTKAKAKSVAFFTPELFDRYRGYRDKRETKRQTERSKASQKQQQQAEVERMKVIFADFERREHAYFQQAYEKIADEDRIMLNAQLREQFTNNPMYFNEDGQPTESGKREVGSYYVTHHTPYNRRLTFQKIAEREFGAQVDFDEKGVPFFVKIA
jgi:hypothetical protein